MIYSDEMIKKLEELGRLLDLVVLNDEEFKVLKAEIFNKYYYQTILQNYRYKVILKSFGTNKIRVIGAIRQITGLGLADGKELVESIDAVIKENISLSEAEEIKKNLHAQGAVVEIEKLDYEK